MTGNEKLIEEAAKAIFAEEQCDRHQRRDAESVTENWETRLADADQSEYRSFARAALAVFEKVLTPTDDERGWAEYRDATPGNNTPEQRRAFFAALGRSEVPEPSAEDRIARVIDVLSWRPEHDGNDPARVQDDYMRRAQAADTALAILTEKREGAF